MTSRMTILNIEDNPGDARLLREAVDSTDEDIDLRVTSDGQGAIDLLLNDDGAPAFVPDLILLDCHLPDVSGEEVLRRIKTHAQLRRIPVVVLSDDDTDETVAAMYDAHANAYVTKPDSLDGYARIVACLLQFWSGISEPPLPEVDG